MLFTSIQFDGKPETGWQKFVSSTNKVTLANGISCSVENHKKIYLEIILYEDSRQTLNNFGWISLGDQPVGSNARTYSESFTIYSVKLNDNGTYYYWTTDRATDGQIVLFEKNNSDAITTVTMSRYSPTDKNKVLKRVVYYID